MEDKLLIDGLFARDERSVARLEEKYSSYCYTVAYAVVRCREDAQECVGDAMLGAWNSIPPNRPENLGAYVGRIARNSALNMLKARRSKKREDLLSRLLSPQMQHGRHGAAVGRVRQLVLVAFQLVLHAVIGRVRRARARARPNRLAGSPCRP